MYKNYTYNKRVEIKRRINNDVIDVSKTYNIANTKGLNIWIKNDKAKNVDWEISYDKLTTKHLV